MSDVSILNMSDDIKSFLRNSTLSTGFLVLFIMFFIRLTAELQGKTVDMILGEYVFMFRFVFFAALMVLGIILALLHKRDLFAILFMLFAMFLLIPTLTSLVSGGKFDYSTVLPFCVVFIALAFMIYLTENKQRYVCSTLLLLLGVVHIIMFDMGTSGYWLYFLFDLVSALICIYCCFCIGFNNPAIPGYDILTVNEVNTDNKGRSIDFKVAGAILGYMLFAVPMLAYAMYYLGIGNITMQQCSVFGVVCGVMMVIIGLLCLVAGRMKFTPFMFMMLGVIGIMTSFISEIGQVSFVFHFMVGCLILFRPDEKELLGYTVIIYGCSCLISPWLTSLTYNNPMSVVFNLIPFMLMIYISFSLCIDRKLPFV